MKVVFRNPDAEKPRLVQAAMFAEDGEPNTGLTFKKDEEDDNAYKVRSVCWDYEVMGSSGWMVKNGAFADSISKYGKNRTGRKLPMLYNHCIGNIGEPPIGCWDKLYNHSNQLIAEGRIFKRSAKGDYIAFLCEEGALGAVSVQFWIDEVEKGAEKPTAKKAELLEVSVVDIPGHSKAEMFSGGMAASAIETLFGSDIPLLSSTGEGAGTTTEKTPQTDPEADAAIAEFLQNIADVHRAVINP